MLQSTQAELLLSCVLFQRGTRFEVGTVLRQVVDGTLAKEPGTPQTTMVVRAKAILVIGSLLSSVKADETDEERREMERCVLYTAGIKSS